MLRLTRRSLWEHKRRLVSTVVAIVLGVAFMAGTFVLSDTLDRAFDDLFSDINEEVDAQVQGDVLFSDPFGGDQRRLLDGELVDRVAQVDGVRFAEPFVIAFGSGSTNRVLDGEGEPIGASQGPPTLFENWIDNPEMSPYELEDGRGPEADDEIAMNLAAVDEGDLELGDDVSVVTRLGIRTYQLVGVFRVGTAESAAGAVNVDFTLAEVQNLAGTGTQVNQIFAMGDEGLSEQDVVDRIAPVLPDGSEVITGRAAAAQLSSDVQSGFQFLQIMLSVFGGIALLVGAFVISNTFSILVAQRTRELALLRAVGASRGQVLGSVLLEAVLVGLFSALLGLLGGIGLAKGVTSAFAAFGADLPTDTLALRPTTVVIALVVGVGVTLVAAMIPAVRSTRVKPLAALRDVAVERAGASKLRIAAGLVLLVVSLLNLSAGWRGEPNTDDVPTVGFGAVLMIVAAIVIGPVVAARSVRLLGAALPRLKGVTGRLATENAARSPKRTSATASALIISVALVGFITVFAASAKDSIGKEVSRGFEGDFVVQSSSGFFGPSLGFPTRVADLAAEVDGVDRIAALSFVRGEVTGGGDTWGQFLEPRMTEGDIADLTDGGVVVDVGEAEDHGIEVGDELVLTMVGGRELEVEVQAISDDENLLGYYTITRADYQATVTEANDAWLFGSVEPGADVDDVIADVEDAIAEIPSLEVLDRDGFIGDLAAQITQFVTVIYVLLALSVTIGLIGIANTLSLSIHERVRELGLLRAVGMNRAQLRSSIRWESVLISVLGTLVGLVLGLGLSRAMIEALSSAGLTTYSVPVRSLVTIVVLAVLLGVLASVRPSRRASKMGVLEAIAHD
jgi:putative ABC transport system permease protein